MQMTCSQMDLLLRQPWQTSGSAAVGRRPTIFVELRAKDNTTGIGEVPFTGRAKSILRKINPHKLSFEDLAKSMEYVRNVCEDEPYVECALNVALRDGAAKAARATIYEVLGLGFTERKHFTSFTIGIDQPERVRDKTHDAGEYPILKLKVGGIDDQRNFAAAREAAPEKPILLDANGGWKTKEDALRNIEWLHNHGNVKLVEQPMPVSTKVADWAWLKARSPLPLYGDESFQGAADASQAAACFHGVNIKLAKAGGIDGALTALLAARENGLSTLIGCMIETSVMITAAAHLAELADHLDLDGNLLIQNDPYSGIESPGGCLTFSGAQEPFGLRVCRRADGDLRLRPLYLNSAQRILAALRRI